MTIDTFKRHGNSFRSGVVACNGLMLNEEGKDEFDVTTETFADASKVGSFAIDFRNHVHSQIPTVVAFPNWFTSNGENQPGDTADANFAITDISKTGFVISHSQASIQSYLGFNFAVIGPGMPTKNIKHGIIAECTESGFSKGWYPKYGIAVANAELDDCTPNGTGDRSWNQPFTGKAVGVKVEFDVPFTDIPSVIATPFKDDTPADVVGNGSVSRCIVEAITRSFATVKCGVIDTGNKYRPIPFTFVAVGNSD